MLTISGAPDAVVAAHARQKEVARELFGRLGGLGRAERLRAGVDLLDRLGGTHVAYVVDGYLALKWCGRDVRLYTEADFVLFTHGSGLLRLSSDFASDVVFFDRARILGALRNDPATHALWTELHAVEQEIGLALCAANAPERTDPTFQLRRYDPGEAITTEGDPPVEVYEMLEGHAEVTVGAVRVGEVNRGEIFGEVGFLTESPRTATVTATRSCFVRVVNQDSFLPSMERNPKLLIAIARTLAHRLVALNTFVSDEAA